MNLQQPIIFDSQKIHPDFRYLYHHIQCVMTIYLKYPPIDFFEEAVLLIQDHALKV